MSSVESWPEPVVRVQHLLDSGIKDIPECYVKKPSDRPSLITESAISEMNIPVIDLQDLFSDDDLLRQTTASLVDSACREWGFFQVVNHGVHHQLIEATREAWREFFHLPLEEKQKYANSPSTYEGYGSRLGVEKGVSLDWSDYFFLHYLPISLRDERKWPKLPVSCRELVEKYSKEVVELGGKLMKIFSTNLGLKENYLQEAFGGNENIGACLRVNYYPKCPQPGLTLGISPHSDPGGMTILFPDENVSGLQVHHKNNWVTVKPLPNAFIVNLGDQLQVLSNANYRSVEHRVIVNAEKERVSLAYFYNPRGDIPIKPAEKLITEDNAPLYPCMTFNEYRLYIRTRGPRGKAQVEFLKSPQ
ncbi:probable 2-oxoglutarate-dependent dioxygenase At5g05600 [Olea europaea var. sylvestris]|uniref:probable 2-oxoglutarate-dependent dioxygenase At5g05600 n=1 Tax=Olea europaea var. sylvestris TaxID=158386 RepID=UPI000C1D34DB|nr:probable 2-oxoglutarate-dependent dioxygenase At5g05600 [Olea europaea var. sylvestris]